MAIVIQIYPPFTCGTGGRVLSNVWRISMLMEEFKGSKTSSYPPSMASDVFLRNLLLILTFSTKPVSFLYFKCDRG